MHEIGHLFVRAGPFRCDADANSHDLFDMMLSKHEIQSVTLSAYTFDCAYMRVKFRGVEDGGLHHSVIYDENNCILELNTNDLMTGLMDNSCKLDVIGRAKKFFVDSCERFSISKSIDICTTNKNGQLITLWPKNYTKEMLAIKLELEQPLKEEMMKKRKDE